MKPHFVRRLLLCAVAIGLAASSAPAEDTLPVATERAFPNLRLRRPVVLTNANDGTDRLFVCEQQGVIRVFPNQNDVKEAAVFLDIEKQVKYDDRMNEEGLLGMAFHPKYRENGEFFLYYTTRDADHLSIISRFRVSKDDPNKADLASEEILMKIPQPFWNHNGGTIVFGPDGYLYVGLGDGGAANDPQQNAQDLSKILGKILRIDVDHKEEGKGYAIPQDNPFVNTRGAKPEIYSLGWRNVWRMSFDRKTGELWAADVGQNVWEEIDIVVKGGNYGWSVRESKHSFDLNGRGEPASEKYIEPVFEYHHDVGKSITGGNVYRGQKVPALDGMYLYADYVAGQVWALDYNRDTKTVAHNYQIEDQDKPVVTFGEDEAGEVYFTSVFGLIYRFTPKN